MLTMIKIIYLTESIPSAMPMMMWLNSQAFFLFFLHTGSDKIKIKKTNWRCRRRGNENRGCILNCFVISLPCFPTFCNILLSLNLITYLISLLLVVFLKVTLQCSSQDLPSYVNAMEGTNCELHAINELNVLIIYKHHHFSS